MRGDLVDHDRFDVVSKMVLSTSPSSMLRASLDIARMQMATDGQRLLSRVIELANEARLAIGAHERLSCLDKGLIGQHGVTGFDPTRLCVNVSATGHTGYEVERLLAAENVTMELSDFANVLANITIGHRWEDLERFVTSITAIADRLPPAGLDPRGFVDFALGHIPEQVLSPAEAFHARQERVPLLQAAGRVSAELAATYPPGIPVVVPGEQLTEALVDYLATQVAAGCRIVGPQDPRLETIRVVCE